MLGPLLRYARSRVHDTALAEDAVSETVLAALESTLTFASAAQSRAWLYGVLRHKLVDALRSWRRETPTGSLADDDGDGGGSTADQAAGIWSSGPDPWQHPEQACIQRQFLALVGRCCDALPPAQRQAFVMREWLELDTASICAALAVSEGHLWVLVHRARQRLRESIRRGWLLPPGPGGQAAPAASDRPDAELPRPGTAGDTADAANPEIPG